MLKRFLHWLFDGAVDRDIANIQKDAERETIGEYLGLESHNPHLYMALRRAGK